MASGEFEHSAESKADPGRVWECYTDVDLWRQWSEGVESSELDGEFETGSKGRVKAPSLPSTRFELLDVEPERRFVTKTKLPGGSLLLDHMLEPAEGGGTRITHKLSFDGTLGEVWSHGVGFLVKRDLPASVERLAELAVEKDKQEHEAAERDEERDERMAEADKKFKEEIKKTAGDRDGGGASLPGEG